MAQVTPEVMVAPRAPARRRKRKPRKRRRTIALFTEGVDGDRSLRAADLEYNKISLSFTNAAHERVARQYILEDNVRMARSPLFRHLVAGLYAVGYWSARCCWTKLNNPCHTVAVYMDRSYCS
jgi:hypothetical protein